MQGYAKLVLAVILCEASGIIGSFLTIEAITGWYNTLQKPFFNPPPWIFGPVWTTLYLLMGIALFLIWRTKVKKEKAVHKNRALNYFYVQLALNALWSIIFFGFKLPWVALVEIFVMWVFIFLTIKSFYGVNKTASFLLYPYIAWVTFAAFLNASIAFLN